MSTSATAVQRWRDLKEQVARETKALDRLKRRLQTAEEQVLAAFEREGVSQLKVDGKTCFLRREIHASGREGKGHEIAEAFRALGFGDLVNERVMPSTLAAFVRERQALGEPIPEPLAPLIHVHEQFVVRATRGSGA